MPLSGLRAIFGKGEKKSSSRSKTTPLSAAEPSAALSEPSQNAASSSGSTALGWEEIKRIGELRRIWAEVQLTADPATQWAAIPSLACETAGHGWDESHESPFLPLPPTLFQRVFEDGTGLATVISKLVATKARGVLLVQDSLASSKHLLQCREFAAAMALLRFLCQNGLWGGRADQHKNTVGIIASRNVPSLLVLLVEPIVTTATDDDDEGLLNDTERTVFSSLTVFLEHSQCLDDLKTGGCLGYLLEFLVRGLKGGEPTALLAASCANAGLLLAAAARHHDTGGEAAVLALKPVQTLLSTFGAICTQQTTASPKMCRVIVSALRLLADLLLGTRSVEQCPYATFFNAGGGPVKCAHVVMLCDGSPYIQEAIGIMASLTRVPQKDSSVPVDEAALFYTSDVGKTRRRPVSMFEGPESTPDSRKLARNPQVFAELAGIALSSRSAVAQQSVVEAMMGIFNDHPENYAALQHTGAVSILLRKLSTLQPEGQLSVVQLLQYVIQQLNYRPQQAIFTAVSVVSEALPPRTHCALFRSFSGFLDLDAAFQAILRDAGLANACADFFGKLGDNTRVHSVDSDTLRAAAAAADLTISLLKGGGEAALNNLDAFTKQGGVTSLAKCASRPLLAEVKLSIRRLLLAAAIADGERDLSKGSVGLLERAMSFLAANGSAALPEWGAVGEVLAMLLHFVSTRPCDSPVFNRMHCAGGAAVFLSLLKPLSPGKWDPDPLAPALARAVMALASCMAIRHPSNLGCVSSNTAKLLAAVVGPDQAFWDLVSSAMGEWMTEHESLLDGSPRDDSDPYNRLVGGSVVFPAALSASLGLLPSLSPPVLSRAVLLLQKVSLTSPLLIYGDVASADAMVDLAEREWPNYAPGGVLDSLVPHAMAAWHQPSQLRRLAALMHNPSPVANLRKAAFCTKAAASCPRWADRVAFTGAGSSIEVTTQPSSWPPSNGLTISAWFTYRMLRHRVKGGNGDTANAPMCPILARWALTDHDRRRLFCQVGVTPRGTLEMVYNYATDATGANYSENPAWQCASFDDIVLQEGVVYNITLVQSRYKVSASDIAVYIDGVLRQRAYLAYPSLFYQPNSPLTGATIPAVTVSVGIGQLRSHSPFASSSSRPAVRWEEGGRLEMAQLRLLDAALCPTAVRMVHLLGAGYLGHFQETDLCYGLSIPHMVTASCSVLTAQQLRMVQNMTSAERCDVPSRPQSLKTSPDLELLTLLPSSGRDQAEPTLCRSRGVAVPPTSLGNVINLTWSEPGGMLVCSIAARGIPQLLLGWALEGVQLDIPAKPDTSALKEVLLASLTVLGRVADYDSMAASDYAVHMALAELLGKHPHTIDDNVVNTLVHAAFHHRIVRSLPLIRYVMLDFSLWKRCSVSSAVLLLQSLRECIESRITGDFNCARLIKGANVCQALLLGLLGDSVSAPAEMVAAAIAETLRVLLVTLRDPVLLESCYRKTLRFVHRMVVGRGRKTDEKGAFRIPTLHKQLVAIRLLRILVDTLEHHEARSAKAAQSTQPQSTAAPTVASAAVLQVLSVVGAASAPSSKQKKEKVPKAALTLQMQAVLSYVDTRWFITILHTTRHPVLASLTLRLLGFALRTSTDFQAAFSKNGGWRALRTILPHHCNQPEVYTPLLTLLFDRPPHIPTDPFTLSREIAEGVHADTASSQMMTDLLPLLLSLISAGHVLAGGGLTAPAFPIVVNERDFFSSLPASSARARKRWRKVALFTAALMHLRRRLLPSFKFVAPPRSVSPSTPNQQRCSENAAELAATATQCLALALGKVDPNDGLYREGTIISALVEAAFSTVPGLLVETNHSLDAPRMETQDDFVFVLEDDDLAIPAGGGDTGNLSDACSDEQSDAGSDLSLASMEGDAVVTTKDSFVTEPVEWTKSVVLFKEGGHGLALIDILAEMVAKSVFVDNNAFTPLDSSYRAQERKKVKGDRVSVAARSLHAALQSFPSSTAEISRTYELLLMSRVIQAIRNHREPLASDTVYLRNTGSLFSYMVSYLHAGFEIPISELLIVCGELLEVLEGWKSVGHFKTMWSSCVNRLALWLLHPPSHPRSFTRAFEILLSALPIVLHPANTDPTFLQLMMFRVFELLQSKVEEKREKALLVLKLFLDTYRGTPALAEVFVHDRKNRISAGFDQLDGTPAGAARFFKWLSESESELRDFFRKHMRRSRHNLRQEEKKGRWIRSTLHSARTVFLVSQQQRADESNASLGELLEGDGDVPDPLPSVLSLPCPAGALLRGVGSLIYPPSFLSRSTKWPLKVSASIVPPGRLGPILTTASAAPVDPSPKPRDTKDPNEHARYRLSPLELDADGFRPLASCVYPIPLPLPAEVDTEPCVDTSLSPSAVWLCNTILAQTNDTLAAVYNAYRIWYLEATPVIVIVGNQFLHFVSHCRINELGNVEHCATRSGQRPEDAGKEASTASASGGVKKGVVGGLLATGWKGLRDVLGGASPGRGHRKTSTDEKMHRVLLSHTLGPLFNEGYVWEVPLAAITELIPRRLNHEPVALEIVMEPCSSVLLGIANHNSVVSEQERNSFYKHLLSVVPGVLDAGQAASLKEITQLWKMNTLSNLDYLLAVNAAAGRTVHDINQYPVFPWVIANNGAVSGAEAGPGSDELNLDDPATYRDLSLPMGALDKKRAEAFNERYDQWEEELTGVPKFHYGSHYSTPMMVLWYLTRLQPFTTMAIIYQGGKLDLADRLFHSIGDAWHSASRGSMTDVKELIPEFFYDPSFLVNHNRLRLGSNRDGDELDHVVLPPWAKGSAKRFVHLQRSALESTFVSSKLHHWIDLIFGFAQQGDEARLRLNVFYHLSYAGSLEAMLGSVEDAERWAAVTQVAQFGQTPLQLWSLPHVRRTETSTPSPVLAPPSLSPRSSPAPAVLPSPSPPVPAGERLCSMCRHLMALQCPAVLFPPRDRYISTPATLTWVMDVSVSEALGSHLVAAGPGVVPLGHGQGYVDAGRRDGYLRVHAADGALISLLRLPCGVKGGNGVAGLAHSGVIFLGTSHGTLAVQIERDCQRRSVLDAPLSRSAWSAGSHPTFRRLRPLYRLLGHWGPVDRVLLVPRTSILITESTDGGPAMVWHVGVSRAAYAGLLKQNGALVMAKYLASRRWLFTCTVDTVYIWDITDLELLCEVNIHSHLPSITGISALEPLTLPGWEGRQYFTTGHGSGKIVLWSIDVSQAGEITRAGFEVQLPHSPQLASSSVVQLLQRPAPYVAYPSGTYYATSQMTGDITTQLPILYSAHQSGLVLKWVAGGLDTTPPQQPLWPL